MSEKGLEIPTVQVDLRKNEQLSSDFRKLNPWCTVPVLVLDDGTAISEVAAVCALPCSSVTLDISAAGPL